MKKFIFFFGCLWTTLVATANNVVISNISLVDSSGNWRVQFDLSWDNGWRVTTGQNNYDGVWVFFKYRLSGGAWQHLYLNGTGNTVAANYTAYQNSAPNKTGAIIHRTNDFMGTSTLTDIELGIFAPFFGIEIRGFAIEMVYIPQCDNCFLGDGDGVSESDFAFHVSHNSSGTLGSTFFVDANAYDDTTMEAGIAINAAGIEGNASFPTGQAFWCMKYEMSQAAYRDFLNTLTPTQQTTRTFSPPTAAIGTSAMSATVSERNFIEIATPALGLIPAVYGCDGNNNNTFDEASDGEWVACNKLSWMDITAYLDWAGLAPMTEVMFERICRGASTSGHNPPVFGEYAWGNALLFSNHYELFLLNSTANEIVANASTTLGNAMYGLTSSGLGPLRNGIFATAASNRTTSGSAFYGVMEMSGNQKEPCVTVGNTAGRAFTGINGNGVLSGSGNANVLKWPCGSAAPCNDETAEGTIGRGGYFQSLESELRTSSRSANAVTNTTRSVTQGGRGVLYIQ